MRVKAVISYDGGSYQGFQRQTSTPHTISGEIEKALCAIHINSPITGSGRTDAGVHASGQVIHFDLPPFWHDLKKLKAILNRKLTRIYFKHICRVNDDFHARFGAKKRVYRYLFKTSAPSIFEKNYISYYEHFNPQRLKEALLSFEGLHDFNLFRKTGSITHTTIREIYRAYYIERRGQTFIYFEANGFLRSQVRMMVDMALAYAQHKVTLEQLHEQLSGIQKHHTKLAPAQGLYLAKVLY